MESFSVLLSDFSDTVQIEDIAGILCTWQFHAMFLAFNLSIHAAVFFKYGIFITFVSIDNSYHSVLYALVNQNLTIEYVFNAE